MRLFRDQPGEIFWNENNIEFHLLEKILVQDSRQSNEISAQQSFPWAKAPLAERDTHI